MTSNTQDSGQRILHLAVRIKDTIPILGKTSKQLGINLLSFSFPVLLNKFFYPSFRIHKFLFAGKKRVTLRTYLYVNVGPGGTGMNHITTGTDYRRFLIFGM